MAVLTQEMVDDELVNILAEWGRIVKSTGESSPAMAAIMDKTGAVTSFMVMYMEAKEAVEAKGLFMPELLPDLKITLSD